MIEPAIENTTSSILQSRFENAEKDNSSYRNCAGFVSYMLGKNDTETLVNTSSLAQSLQKTDQIPFTKNLSEEEYLRYAADADIVSIYIDRKDINTPNTIEEMINSYRKGPIYLHFALIDPMDRTKIYQRPDVEQTAQHVNWKEVLEGYDDLNSSEMSIVFFKQF